MNYCYLLFNCINFPIISYNTSFDNQSLLFLFDGSISSYKIPNMILGFFLGGIKGILSLVLFSGIFERFISLDCMKFI